MPTIIFTESYNKKAIKFFKANSQILPKYKKTLLLLQKNPFHPSLRFHNLEGKLQSYQSVSINMKYRIMLDYVMKDDEIILLDIGVHELYK